MFLLIFRDSSYLWRMIIETLLILPLKSGYQYQSVAVFCGSRSGDDPIYEQHAKDLGKLIGQNNLTLVYGGRQQGIDGRYCNAALQQNGRVIGVIPEILKDIEVHHTQITKLHVVADMHIRKKMMYEMCDIAIILPAAMALDELFE